MELSSGVKKMRTQKCPLGWHRGGSCSFGGQDQQFGGVMRLCGQSEGGGMCTGDEERRLQVETILSKTMAEEGEKGGVLQYLFVYL